MRNTVLVLTVCTLVSCGLAQNKAAAEDPQLAAIAEEIEGWKKEMVKNAASRASIEDLLRKGITFQKVYAAETDSIVKSGLIEDYIEQRDKALAKLPVTFFLTYGGELSYPFEFVFDKDDLELDAKRPFLFRRKGPRGAIAVDQAGKLQMLFSYKESQRFANMLTRFIAKARLKEATSVSMRDCVVSIQMQASEASIIMQPKGARGTVNSSEAYRISEFDAKLLVARINKALATHPQSAGYTEPDDLDPATALFVGGADEASAASGAAPVGSLTLNVSRIKVTQGQSYGYNARVFQQFDYRASFRWNGAQPVSLQVIMYLVGMQNNKLSLVGRVVKETTVEPGRSQEVQLTAEQVIPGATASGVIVQCFSGGRLMKSFASLAQYQKYAEMPDLESQLPPLYQNPPYYIYPVTR